MKFSWIFILFISMFSLSSWYFFIRFNISFLFLKLSSSSIWFLSCKSCSPSILDDIYSIATTRFSLLSSNCCRSSSYIFNFSARCLLITRSDNPYLTLCFRGGSYRLSVLLIVDFTNLFVLMWAYYFTFLYYGLYLLLGISQLSNVYYFSFMESISWICSCFYLLNFCRNEDAFFNPYFIFSDFYIMDSSCLDRCSNL